MSERLARLAALFVEPTPPPAAPAVSPAPPAVALVAERAGGLGLAALLALGLARETRATAALLAVWPGEALAAAARMTATPRARRTGGALAARGLEARATGRLVRVALPTDAGRAVTVAGRAIGASGLPAVAAVLGPRPATLDPLLAAQDLVLVAAPAGGDPHLADLAVQAAATAARRAAPCPLRPGPLAKALATVGLDPGGTRAALGPVLSGIAR